MAPADRLDRASERARYETHENDPRDPRYRAFLRRLCTPLVARLPRSAEGLDYGSGPGPTLSVMLEEQGFPMALYDPFYAPDETVLQRTYDFVTCTETAEHFFSPARELERIDRLLRPGGWLGLMTQVLEEGASFSQWYYARDPSHVSFYRARTLRWIAQHRRWELELLPRGVALFRKPAG
jgi:SAM-dependent methyltransferase